MKTNYISKQYLKNPTLIWVHRTNVRLTAHIMGNQTFLMRLLNGFLLNLFVVMGEITIKVNSAKIRPVIFVL